MIAFRGVRSSWLMLARNALLARLASSEASTAATSASSIRLRSEMSMIAPTVPTIWPDASRRGEPLTSAQKRWPSLRRKLTSYCSETPCIRRAMRWP